jgi:hypothetical protein
VSQITAVRASREKLAGRAKRKRQAFDNEFQAFSKTIAECDWLQPLVKVGRAAQHEWRQIVKATDSWIRKLGEILDSLVLLYRLLERSNGSARRARGTVWLKIGRPQIEEWERAHAAADAALRWLESSKWSPIECADAVLANRSASQTERRLARASQR